MSRRLAVVVGVLCLSAFGACVGQVNPAGVSDDGGIVIPEGDGALPSDDAGNPLVPMDSSQPTHVDASDASDANVAVGDDSSDAADSNVPDTNDANVVDAHDANVVDANDANEVDAHDANVVDAHDADIVDTGPDVFDAGPPRCTTAIFGDYYVRTDGTLVYFANGNHVVMNGSTSAPLATVTQVAAQVDHSCALLADQTVWCWPTNTGSGNTNGDLGNGTIGGSQAAFTATQVVTQAIDAGPEVYLTNVTSLHVAAGNTIYNVPTCAIRSDKTLWCWGTSTGDSSPPAGVFWGTTASEAPQPHATAMALAASPDGSPPPIIKADQVTVGADHICYLLSGKVFCFGENASSNLGTGSPNDFEPYPAQVVTTTGLPTTVTQLAAGYRFTCALSGGDVWCWGDNTNDQMGDPSAPPSTCINPCEASPVPVQQSLADAGVEDAGLGGVTSIVGGYQFACSLDSTGAVRCWGSFSPRTYPEATPLSFLTNQTLPVATAITASAAAEDGTGVHFLSAAGDIWVASNSVASTITQVCP